MARLAGVMIESGDDEAAARGEAELRGVVDHEQHHGAETLAYARFYLAHRYGATGRTDLARRQLDQLHVEFGSRALELFQGLVEGHVAWLDVLDGEPRLALDRIRGRCARCSTR
ncbi:hypothetical protein NKH77_15185 [Streptomyces sp. M19]